MVRDKAIEILKTHQGCLRAQDNGECKFNLVPRCEPCKYYTSNEEFNEAESMAIKALEQQNVLFKSGLLKDCEACRAEQEPCEDVISRKAVLEFLKGFEILHNYDELRSNLIYGIMDIPPVTSQQQTCNDCISREDALMCMTGEYIADMTYKPEDIISKHIQRLRALPSVQSKTGHWIPVTERLPKDRNPVLVTAYWHETYQVMQASYFGDGLWWCVPFNNTGKHVQKLKPKAWMPLPDAYSEAEE